VNWYLCLFIEADSKTIPFRSNNVAGIDPGYKATLTSSSGEKIDKPKQLQRAEKRFAEAQRGKRQQLTARIQERIKNRRKDNIKRIAKRYGKLVAEASHHQLRRTLSYKCTASGRKYIEADSIGSTMTCFPCLAKTGLRGKAGLSVRQWGCAEWGILGQHASLRQGHSENFHD
jgi:transposase